MAAVFCDFPFSFSRSLSTLEHSYERELAHREAISKLQRMLDAEKLQVRMLKETQTEMLHSRTELEMLLRQCLDDVKLEIAKKQLESQGGTAAARSTTSVAVSESDTDYALFCV